MNTNLNEVRQKQRYLARDGDLVGLYGDETREFRLAIALDSERCVVIFDNIAGIKLEIVRVILRNSQMLSEIMFNDEIIFKNLSRNEYEVYSTNIFTTPLKYSKTLEDFFSILRTNLANIQRLIVGDIVKMKGLKLLDKFALYHHHAIFSDAKKFKIIHKWGEPTRTELFQGLIGERGINYAEVREDNILEVACCRELEQENYYDEKFSGQIRSPDMIIVEARKRIGETTYDLLNDNCQHFCTSCRYGVPIAIEVENTKTAIKYGAIAVATTAVLGKLAYSYFNSKKSNQNIDNQTLQKQSSN